MKQLLFATVVYGTIPLILFIIGWMQPVWAIIALVTLIVYFQFFLKETNDANLEKNQIPIPLKTFFVLFAFSIVLTIISGTGGFTQQSIDWEKHNKILFDLRTTTWPTQFETETLPTALVYYLGHYLPSAGIGKLFGLEAQNLALIIWTSVGLLLGFLWLMKFSNTKSVYVCFIILTCGGLDVLGAILHGKYQSIDQHQEWWAQIHLQLSSFSTLLHWVPQHLMAAFVFAPALHYSLKNKLTISTILIGVLTPLYSTFVSVGLMVMCIIWMNRNWFRWKNLFFLLIFFVIFVVYFGGSSQSLKLTLFVKNLQDLKNLVYFLSVEFAPVIVITLMNRKNVHLREISIFIAMIFLLVLPRSGVWNDWGMRTTLPIQMILWFYTSRSVVDFWRHKQQIKAFMSLILLVLTMLTGFSDWKRDLYTFHFKPQFHSGEPGITGYREPHPELSVQYESSITDSKYFLFRYQKPNQ